MNTRFFDKDFKNILVHFQSQYVRKEYLPILYVQCVCVCVCVRMSALKHLTVRRAKLWSDLTLQHVLPQCEVG